MAKILLGENADQQHAAPASERFRLKLHECFVMRCVFQPVRYHSNMTVDAQGFILDGLLFFLSNHESADSKLLALSSWSFYFFNMHIAKSCEAAAALLSGC
ncbi:MAG: hypothetical protein WAZ48_04995 [Lysobacteraceae bacterium]